MTHISLRKKKHFFQYDFHSLKHIFPHQKTTILYFFSIKIWTDFLAICSWCSSLHYLKTLFHAEIQWRVQTSGIQRKPNLNCKENVAAVLNQTNWWFPRFLLQYEALYCPGETQWHVTLEKTWSSYTISCAVPTEIQFFRNVLFCKPKWAHKLNLPFQVCLPLWAYLYLDYWQFSPL